VPVSTVSASSRPGLAQVRVQVDEAGQRDQARGVEDVRAGRVQVPADGGDHAVPQVNVGRLAANHGSPLDQPLSIAPRAAGVVTAAAHSAASSPPSIRYRTAMRTVTSVRDLRDDRRAVGVGHLGGDLHAAVHRARVHDDGVLRQQRHPADVEAVAAPVLADGREVGRVHPLLLHAQHHHHVALAQLRVEVVGGPARPRVDRERHEGGRGDQRHVRAERGQQQHVGPRHPGVQHVADERHPEPVKALATPVGAAEALAHRERVEQRLRGVLVRAVARVDHAPAYPAGQAARGPRRPGA